MNREMRYSPKAQIAEVLHAESGTLNGDEKESGK
jgi:hypothetical protein